MSKATQTKKRDSSTQASLCDAILADTGVVVVPKASAHVSTDQTN